MCGGVGERWSGDGPKQLAEVDGEILLERTVRQLRERDVEAFSIVTREGVDIGASRRCWEVWEDVCLPLGRRVIFSDGVLSDAFGWRDGTYLWQSCLLGDVWYSDEAMDAICAAHGLHVFGRRGGSRLTGCEWGECFAATWNADTIDAWEEALHASSKHARLLSPAQRDEGGSPIGSLWQVYRHIIGVPLHEHVIAIDDPTWVEIDDWTDDFDSVEDLERWRRNREAM